MTATYTFDGFKVRQAVTKGGEKAFKQAGAYVRQVARRSVRVSKKSSKPGEPPKAKGRRFKNSIIYEADAAGVTIGPIRFQDGDSTQAVLEFGGSRRSTLGAIIGRKARGDARLRRQTALPPKKRAPYAGTWREKIARRDAMIERLRNAGKLSKDVLTSSEKKEVKTFRIAARPYMGPALDKSKSKAVELFRKLM